MAKFRQKVKRLTFYILDEIWTIFETFFKG